MENLKLGEIITTEQHRDAIHIAVVPVVASAPIVRGGLVSIAGGQAYNGSVEDAVGVADPFLRVARVEQGQAFWLYLNPGSITSLRHEWTHPALDGTPDTAAARKVVQAMAESMGLSYSALMDYGSEHAKGWDDGYVTQMGDESWRDGFSAETFWPAYELLTGEVVPEDKKEHFFSCSC